MENTVTLTVREILDLSKAAGIVSHLETIEGDDAEIEYTIFGKEGGVIVFDDDNTERTYHHGAYLSEYPEEGIYPLGESITT